ncbi:MAG: cell division protein FtsZ, partial [Deltaproteobacteria bacterium]|nr:cell division protein FtsZ [Deltaproteobacteria bacterium]
MDKKFFEYVPEETSGLGLKAVIKICGVGSGGVNAVDSMIENGVDGVDYVVANTDAQDLLKSKCGIKLVLGMNLTRGLGAGNDPTKGREAALEDKSKITEFLKGADMVFLATSLGGGTGTGSTPVIAEICKSLGILTVAVVTLPFSDEGQRKMDTAQEGLEKMKTFVDAYVVIPNDKLNIFEDENITLKAGLKMIDRVLCDSVTGIVELITRPGHINRDINDVKTVLSEKGQCIMGIGEAAGEGRALRAVEAALANPLLKGTPIHGAEKVLVNIVGRDVTLKERNIVMNFIREIADKNAQT